MQATRTGDVLRGLRKQPYVKAAVVYQLHDNDEYDLGIFDEGGTKKPLFSALSSLWHSKTVPAPRKVKLSLSRSGGRVVASGTGPGGDFYLLRAFTGGRLRYQAIVKLDRNLRFRVKLPGALGSHGVTVRMKYLSGGSVTRSI